MSRSRFNMRVLVVDDEPTLRGLIAEALRESGCTVQTAANGAEALDVLHSWEPNVVVLDLMMPRLDGYGFTQLLRLNPRYAELPVVVVTAAYGPGEAAARVGARAVFAKPFELEQLVGTVIELAGGGLKPPEHLLTRLPATRVPRPADSAPPLAEH